MPRCLTTIARFINMHMPGYRAEVVEDHISTGSEIPGMRHSWEGRYGNRLLVYKDEKEVLDHRSAEAYKRNEDVEIWLKRELEKMEQVLREEK